MEIDRADVGLGWRRPALGVMTLLTHPFFKIFCHTNNTEAGSDVIKYIRGCTDRCIVYLYGLMCSVGSDGPLLCYGSSVIY